MVSYLEEHERHAEAPGVDRGQEEGVAAIVPGGGGEGGGEGQFVVI